MFFQLSLVPSSSTTTISVMPIRFSFQTNALR
jgi:hypothetical protein